jgi:type I restriction enzyme S subunit
MVKLTDVCRPKQWKTISSKNLTSDGYPVYGANGKIGFYSSFTHIKPTVLITCRGATCGTINICEPMSYVNGNAMALDELSSDVNINYLSYFLSFRGLEDVISGSAQPQITRIGLKNLKIPLPPLPTQTRIARALDLADRHRRLLREELDAYDRLGESLFLEMFGDPVRNEMGWDVCTLKKVCSKIGSGSTPRGGKEAYLESGIPLVRSLNIYDDFFKKKNLAYLSDKQADKLKNVTIQAGDVLFNITGASVCRCCVAPNFVTNGRVNQHVAILRSKTPICDSVYLMSCLISENQKQLLLRLSTNGGATREAITKDGLSKLKIPLPPLPLQTEFAARIEKINLLKAKTQTTLKEADDLFNALLQRAFRGELFVE